MKLAVAVKTAENKCVLLMAFENLWNLYVCCETGRVLSYYISYVCIWNINGGKYNFLNSKKK